MTRALVSLGLIGIALLGASCAAFRKPEPVIRTEYQTVSKPVAVPCLKPDQVPNQPTRLSEDTPDPPDLLTLIVARLRAKLKEWQDSYGPTSQELLQACSKLPDPRTVPPQ